MPVVIIAQVIGFIAVCENLFIYLSNKRDRILQLKFLSDALWARRQCVPDAMHIAPFTLLGIGGQCPWIMRAQAGL